MTDAPEKDKLYLDIVAASRVASQRRGGSMSGIQC